MEEIPLGSNQFRPSSEKYESGVDDLSNPKTYVIWDAYRNSHIFPEYIISFQSPCLRGKQFIIMPFGKFFFYAICIVVS